MIIPVGYAQVNYIFGGDGLPHGAQVTFGVDNRDSDADALTVATEASTAWTGNIQAATNQHVTLLSVLAKKGPNSTGASAEISVGEAGANTTGDFQPNCCALVKKITALGGRHGRGRTYWPVLGESDIDNAGVVKSTFLSGFQGAVDDWLDALAAANLPLVLLHASASVSPTPVTSLSVETVIATQRRRLRG